MAAQPNAPGCLLVNVVISPSGHSHVAMKGLRSAKILLQVLWRWPRHMGSGPQGAVCCAGKVPSVTALCSLAVLLPSSSPIPVPVPPGFPVVSAIACAVTSGFLCAAFEALEALQGFSFSSC